MTNPTPFDKALDALNLTYAQKTLIKQDVAKYVLGSNEKYNDTYEPDKFKAEYLVWQNGRRVCRNELRNEQRINLYGETK